MVLRWLILLREQGNWDTAVAMEEGSWSKYGQLGHGGTARLKMSEHGGKDFPAAFVEAVYDIEAECSEVTYLP